MSDNFTLLYRNNYAFVYNHCFRLLENHQDSEEISNDVFLKLWESKDIMKISDKELRAWLYRVTYNASIDTIRKRRSKSALLMLKSERNKNFREIPCERLPPINELIEEEFLEIIEGALLKVANYKHRIAYILLEFEGYKVREVADILNKKPGTVKIWIYRCKKDIQNILGLKENYL